MKILKWILIVLAGLLILLFLLSLLIPSKSSFEQSIQINTPANHVYSFVVDYEKWPLWDPWADADPEMTNVIEGTPGIGHKRTWESKTQGNGSMEIVEMEPGKMMKAKLMFENSNKPAWDNWLFEENEEGVEVKWTVEIETGINPITKYMFFFAKKIMTNSMEKGLSKLQELAESTPVVPEIQITEKELPTQKYIGIKKTLSFKTDNIEAFFGEAYQTLMAFLTKNKVPITAAPVAFYHAWDEKNQVMETEAAIPVPLDFNLKLEKGIELSEVTAGKAVSAIHYGAYDKVGAVWNALETYIGEKKLEIRGVPYEIYLVSHDMEPDTSKWMTEIVYPVK